MMAVDKYGNSINLEKVWGIEHGFSEGRFDSPIFYWTVSSKYKSQRAMIQALNDLRKHNPATVRSRSGKGEWVQSYSHYRPVHISYSF